MAGYVAVVTGGTEGSFEKFGKTHIPSKFSRQGS